MARTANALISSRIVGSRAVFKWLSSLCDEVRWAVALKIIVVQSTEDYDRMSGEPMVQSDGMVMRLFAYHSSDCDL